MTYVCCDCGNIESFSATQDVTRYEAEAIYIDGEGEITDYGDSDTYDSDRGDMNDIECSDCGSCDIEWIDEDDEVLRRSEEAKLAKLEEEQKRKEIKIKITNWKKHMEELKK